MIYGNNTIYEQALQTHEDHSRRLGYVMFVMRKPVLDGVWNKYVALLSTLIQELEKPVDRRLQWLFWFDSDTVIMNPNMPLETFLPPSHFPDIRLLLSKDWNGMNNGVFFLRVHPWSVELLTAAISYPVLHPDVDLHWPDQSALMNILNENDYFSRSVEYCPLRWFNAYMRSTNGRYRNLELPRSFQVHPGDLLVHFPGTRPENLNTTLAPYIAIANAHEPEWELSLENTKYIQKTKDFWDNIDRAPTFEPGVNQ
ncbi:hypothetical protein PHISCL_07268 [Aspergillus sclerotialis]|uniref:Galactosyl transferase GMA12/MNN10 family protein n=1 Tax=Aspergillus sclerotialis TaxID=2070753 RepID=A0A3A2ZGA4_9EURO|nr:hypothetical protein PHISCL_07268 [Aspergillus sclerotialis]